MRRHHDGYMHSHVCMLHKCMCVCVFVYTCDTYIGPYITFLAYTLTHALTSTHASTHRVLYMLTCILIHIWCNTFVHVYLCIHTYIHTHRLRYLTQEKGELKRKIWEFDLKKKYVFMCVLSCMYVCMHAWKCISDLNRASGKRLYGVRCMYVCMCVCIVGPCELIIVCMNVCVYVCMYVCMYVWWESCERIIEGCKHFFVLEHAYKHTYANVCVYLYMYVHTCTHTYTNINMYLRTYRYQNKKARAHHTGA